MKLSRLRVVVMVSFVLGVLSVTSMEGQPARSATPALDRLLPARVEHVYRALVSAFSPARAMDIVTFMSKSWRLPGNPGFEASQDVISRQLADAGFRPRDAEPGAAAAPSGRAPVGSQWYEDFALNTPAWEPMSATIALVDAPADERSISEPALRTFGPSPLRIDQTPDSGLRGSTLREPQGRPELLRRATGSPRPQLVQGRTPDSIVLDLSRPLDRVSLCINSFSTPAEGVRAPLVFVGRGVDAADYANVDVRGKIVLGHADTGRLFNMAVRQRGAAGVLSDSAADYTRPDDTPDVVQWSGIPYDETLHAFGFKVSRRLVSLLTDRLAAGDVLLKVDVATTFRPGRNRTLVAEIPGRSRAAERIVLVAHVQEPGANDNASGCATLMEMARSLAAGIARGAIPPPARTLTFLWGDEIAASRQWLRADPSRAGSVRHAFSLDMTGEDVARTGGAFLIEKQPDPSAVWVRPSDPHTEWGRGSVSADTLVGDLLNDLHLAVCLRRARDTGWVVKANPYEGGSDHSVFLATGVPALLDWHFTDRYYHTNLDTPDKTSPREMANVGIAVGATAWLLASADDKDGDAVARLLERAALARLDLEARQSAEALAQATGSAEAQAQEEKIFAAWQKWYAEALQSALRLPVNEPGSRLKARVQKATERVRAATMR